MCFTVKRTPMDLTKVPVSGRSGDFNSTCLAAVINTPEMNGMIVNIWLNIAGANGAPFTFFTSILSES